MNDEGQLQLAQLFAEVARDLAAQPCVRAAASRIEKVASTVVACPWAHVIRRAEHGSLIAGVPTDPVLNLAFVIMTETGEGVVLDAQRGDPVLAPRLRSDARWPRYTQRVIDETPIRSAAAYPLRLGSVDLGVLALYSDRECHFDEPLAPAAAVLADHASLALAQVTAAERIANLEIALTTNRTIGVAIGVLMARSQVTQEAAFDMLRTTSQHTHCKLRDVADYVVDAGELPAFGNTSTGVSHAA